MTSQPLAPTTYLWRNTGKSIPLILVIVLSVMLIAGIVSIMNSIPLSIRTIYRYSERSLGITPRGDVNVTPRVYEELKATCPVPIERIIVCRAADTEVKSIVGKWPFVVLALKPDDLDYYIQKHGGKALEGRLPQGDQPEAVVSRPVARNLGLKLGGELLGPDRNVGYSPRSVRIVGLIDSPEWIALMPYGYHAANHFPPLDVLAVFAPDLPTQRKLDDWAVEKFKGDRARLFSYAELEKSTNEMFKILYKILNVVIFILVAVITLVVGLLMNIYQSQRVQEFALLQALGYTKQSLLKRVIAETALVIMGGWILGVFAAIGLLQMVYLTLMEPQAFALNPFDPQAYLYSLPVPIAILGVGIWTILHRFKTFDPVGVVERRLV